MSFSRTKSDRDYQRALQSFAESEAVSGEESDDGFDIVESSRKVVDLSQYIEGGTPPRLVTDECSLTHHSPHSDTVSIADC